MMFRCFGNEVRRGSTDFTLQSPISTDDTRLNARHQPRRRSYSVMTQQLLFESSSDASEACDITNRFSVAAPEQDEVDDAGRLPGLRVDGERAGVWEQWPTGGTKVIPTLLCRSPHLRFAAWQRQCVIAGNWHRHRSSSFARTASGSITKFELWFLIIFLIFFFLLLFFSCVLCRRRFRLMSPVVFLGNSSIIRFISIHLYFGFNKALPPILLPIVPANINQSSTGMLQWHSCCNHTPFNPGVCH